MRAHALTRAHVMHIHFTVNRRISRTHYVCSNYRQPPMQHFMEKIKLINCVRNAHALLNGYTKEIRIASELRRLVRIDLDLFNRKCSVAIDVCATSKFFPFAVWKFRFGPKRTSIRVFCELVLIVCSTFNECLFIFLRVEMDPLLSGSSASDSIFAKFICKQINEFSMPVFIVHCPINQLMPH